jgi:peptide chain release factor 1
MQLTESQEELPKIEEELRVQLLPKDPNDEKNILLEVHPAA